MCDSSRWKRRGRVYPTDRLRFIGTSKWEYPIPKSKAYWEKFFEEARKKILKVRDPSVQVSYRPLTVDYPVVPKRPRGKTVSRYDFSTEFQVDKHESRPVSACTNFPSKSQSRVDPIKFSTNAATEEQRFISSKQSVGSSVTNLKSSPFRVDNHAIKHDNAVKKEGPSIETLSPSGRDNGHSTNNVSTRRNVYNRSTCPFHKHEPSIQIFDDDIERYLTNETTLEDSLLSPENLQRTYSSSRRAKDRKIRTPKLLISEQDSWSASYVETPSPVGNARYSLTSTDVKNHDKTDDADLLSKTVKATQIPKLGAASLQPSFVKISTDNRDKSYSRCTDQIGLEAFKVNGSVDESNVEPEQPSTLSTTQLAPKKKSLKSSASGDSEIRSSAECVDAKESTLSRDMQTEEETEEKPRTRRSLRYSIRCAYRALKFLTANKKLCFEPRIIEEKCEDSSRQSTDALSGDDIDDGPPLQAKARIEDKLEALCLREVQEKLKRSQDKNVDLKDLEPKYTKTRTIFTTSRSTSGTSPKFANLKPQNDSSTSFLAEIPKLSYPRKLHDRCLSCIYSSLVKPIKKASSPARKTMLQKSTLIESISDEAAPYLDSDSSSASTLGLSDEPREPSNEIKANIVVDFVQEDGTISKDLKSAAVTTSRSMERQKTVRLANIVNQKYSGSLSSKIDTKEERIIGHSSSSKIPTNLRTTSLSVDKPKIDSSPDVQSSEDEDSPIYTLNDDASKTKCIAPCHMPTIFKPSLEPLRALKLKKPTTLQSRIAANEATSMKKATSIDDDYDDDLDESKSMDARKAMKTSEIIVGKSSVSKVDVSKESKEGKDDEVKDVPSSRGLTKARSVLDKLTLEISEPDSKKEQPALRKGLSFSSFTTRDLTSESSPLLRTQKFGPAPELSDLVRPARFPKFADFPLVSADEITAILKSFVERDAPSTEMLEALCKEFVGRVSKGNADLNSSRRNKIATRLTRLLVDSKRYLRPEKFPSDRVFSSKQPPLCNSRQLRRILPLDSYNLVAPLLGMPKWYPRKATFVDGIDLKRHRVSRKRSSEELPFDLMVHPPSPRDVASSEDEEGTGRPRLNPYALFLKKPRRKVVTWRPLTAEDLKGYDPEATLNMRARNITDKICREFCQWLKDLGGTDKVIDEEVLRDMFEIDFTAEACRAMEISINEMPMVPTEVALTRNCPGASMLAMTKKQLIEDAKAERRSAKVHAFGTGMPPELRFVPPKNHVRKNWLHCEHVPRDLETMETVWKGITQLDSVRGFVNWLREHPEVSPPEALKTIASVDIGDTPHAHDDETSAHLELDLDQIHSLKVGDNDPGRTA